MDAPLLTSAGQTVIFSAAPTSGTRWEPATHVMGGHLHKAEPPRLLGRAMRGTLRVPFQCTQARE